MGETSRKYTLCNLDELVENKAFCREIAVSGRDIPCLVYGTGADLQVFLNSCPHTGVRLEWRPDDFLDASERYLQCAMHGALFQPDSGLCIAGPCVNQNLVKIPFEVCGKQIRVIDPDKVPLSAREAS